MELRRMSPSIDNRTMTAYTNLLLVFRSWEIGRKNKVQELRWAGRARSPARYFRSVTNHDFGPTVGLVRIFVLRIFIIWKVVSWIATFLGYAWIDSLLFRIGGHSCYD